MMLGKKEWLFIMAIVFLQLLLMLAVVTNEYSMAETCNKLVSILVQKHSGLLLPLFCAWKNEIPQKKEIHKHEK